MACVDGRTDPDLWEKSKKKAIAKLGGRFSARAMQLAGKLYRDAGGGYCGGKTKAQKSMKKWSDEDWTTADGKPARRKVDGKVVYDRYLPKAAWKRLTKAQKLATRRKKRASDDQFVANTAKAAKAGKKARGESMDYLNRYRELTQPRIVAPWDVLSEAVGEKFVDIEKVKADAITKTIRNAAVKFFKANPTETVFFIRDPKQVLALHKRKEIADDIEDVLSGEGMGSYGAFGFDNSDFEIYADGAGPFGGEWDYAVTQALDAGQNNALDKMPPKVTLEPVQGKTSLGWKLVISHPYKTYKDAGLKAAEAEAMSMMLKGFYPQGEQSPYSAAPKELRAKAMRKGPKTYSSAKKYEGRMAESAEKVEVPASELKSGDVLDSNGSTVVSVMPVSGGKVRVTLYTPGGLRGATMMKADKVVAVTRTQKKQESRMAELDIPEDVMKEFFNLAVQMEPENLHADGERTIAQAKAQLKKLKARWSSLEKQYRVKLTLDDVYRLRSRHMSGDYDESRKPNEAIRRLSDSRATDMARLKKLAGIG